MAVAWDASLGTSGRVYPLLRAWLPPFRSLRAPARFAMIVLLGHERPHGDRPGSSRAHGFGPHRRAGRSGAGRPRIQHGAAVDSNHPERASAPCTPGSAQQPRQVTLELPVPLPTALPLHDAFYMYAQTWHWHPLANGYSGYYTQDYIDLLKALVGFPDARSSRAMARTGIQRVILHRELFRAGEYEPLVRALDGHPDYHLRTIGDRSSR